MSITAPARINYKMAKSGFKNTLYTNDNLYVLLGLDSKFVDLIYLDPPFNSKRTYSAPVGSKAAGVSFKDMWTWRDVDEYNLDAIAVQRPELTNFIGSIGGIHSKAMMAYLTYMAQRIIEMHRVLKDTGSLYLHCDPTASHYLKIVLDTIFGGNNFRSEIVWRRTGTHNKSVRWAPVHDTILFYTASDEYTWRNPKQPYAQGHVSEHFKKDAVGYKTSYYGNVLTGPGLRKGESGMAWRGFNPSEKGRHWAIPGKLWEDCGMDGAGLSQHEKLDALYAAGFISIVKDQAWPVYERRIRAGEGPATGDIWAYQPYTEGMLFETTEGIDADVSWIKPQSGERIGYPTQKPLGLLKRIISASSNPGDIVLDPFCGCATTCVAAQQENRKWIGIDIEEKATDILIQRLADDSGLFRDFIATDKIPVRTDVKEIQPTETVRQRLYSGQSGKCNACGGDFELRNLETDHIVPKAKGGGDYYENYQLLCASCNRIKGDRPMEYLRTKIANIEKAKKRVFFGD